MNKAIQPQNWVGLPLETRDLSTPAYYFNLRAIINDITRIRAALGGEILQEVTACPLQEMLSRLPETVRFGAVTASRAELNMVAGWDTDHAYFHTAGLTPQLSRAVLGVGHRLIAESPAQIASLAKVRGQRKVQPIMLSVHPSVVIDGALGQFGMLRETLLQAVAVAVEHGILIDGLSLAHTSRFATNRACMALRGMRALAQEVAALTGRPAPRLILGEWTDVLATGEATEPYRADVDNGPEGEVIVHVGGATIFKRAGVLVSRVLDIQTGIDGPRAICDVVVRGDFASSTAQAAPHNLSRREVALVPARLVGSSLRNGDDLGQCATTVEVGDIIAFDNLGAYFRGFDPVITPEGGQLPALLFFDEEHPNA